MAEPTLLGFPVHTLETHHTWNCVDIRNPHLDLIATSEGVTLRLVETYDWSGKNREWHVPRRRRRRRFRSIYSDESTDSDEQFERRVLDEARRIIDAVELEERRKRSNEEAGRHVIARLLDHFPRRWTMR